MGDLQTEARECLDYYGDLFKACIAWQNVEACNWDQWLDRLGREYVDRWLAKRSGN